MKVSIQNKEDLKVYQHYKLQYEHNLMDLRDCDVKQNIIDHFEQVKTDDVCFSTDDIEWMYGYAFSRCSTVRHNDNGTVFASGNIQGVYEKFKDRINSILPGAHRSPVVGGNFFLTPSQYGLHNDSTRFTDWERTLEQTPLTHERRRYVPWRNIIIPLWTCPDKVSSQGVFFEQRHVDYAHVYNHGMPNGQKIATTYPIVRDYNEIDFHLLDGSRQVDNSGVYDREHHEKYLYYTPHRRLTGLTNETTCEWTPGMPITFDAFQLHATNKGSKEVQWENKLGLLLTFLREVE